MSSSHTATTPILLLALAPAVPVPHRGLIRHSAHQDTSLHYLHLLLLLLRLSPFLLVALNPPFPLSFSLFPQVYFCCYLHSFGYTYFFLFLSSSLSPLLLSSPYHLSIYAHTHIHSLSRHAHTLPAMSIVFSLPLPLPLFLPATLSLFLSHGALRGSSSSSIVHSHPHQPALASVSAPRSNENYVTRAQSGRFLFRSFLIFLLWISA